MKNLKYIFLAFCLLFFYVKVNAQLTVINPSFEGTPAMHVTPAPWHTCMLTPLPGQTPDTQPGMFSITMPPSNGSSYVGFVTNGDFDSGDWQEGCSQQLSAPMTAGANWHFTIDVTRENSNDGGITAGDIELLIYAGWSQCDRSQLLYSTGNVPYMSWFTYDVTFTPNNNYTHIFLHSHKLSGAQPYILVDNMSPIEPVCDADAGDGAKICGLTYTFNGTVQAGYYNTYWSVSPSAGVTFGNINSPTSWVTVTTPGLYTFTWTATSPDALTCDDVITVEFTQIPTSPFTTTLIDCGGDNTTIIYTGNATCGAATFTWNFDGGTVTSGNPNNPCAPGFTVNWATVGTHNVTLQVTEDGCTSTPTTVGVYNPPPLVTSIDTTGAIGCAGGSGSVTVNISGGTPDYIVDWGGADPNNLAAGTYSVTITDANACSNIETFTITEPDPLVVTPDQTNLNCYDVCDGYAELIVTGGTGPYVYVWSNAPFHNFPSQDTMCAGTYTVVAIDFNLCEITAYFTITEPAAFTATISDSTDVTCNGICNGTATVTVNGGMPTYDYNWPGGGSSENVTGLCGGSHTVTVTDGNSCPAYATVSIEEPPVLNASITPTNVNCNSGYDGAADLTVTGGTSPYIYQWTYGQTDPDIGNLTAGTYCVTVTDFNLCTSTECVTITEPATPISATTNVTNLLCHGNANGAIELTVSGGTPGYSFLWSNGITDEDINNLAGGNYTVTITDANLCVTLAFATVTEPGELVITTSSNPTICIGQETELTATAIAGTGTPPFTYYWSNGYIGQDPDTVSPDTNSIYYVYAIDSNNCQSNTQNVTVYVFPPLNITLRTDDDTLCPGDSTIIYADNFVGSGNGVGPYIFTNLSDGSIVTPPFTVYPNTTTIYVIQIDDGCTERLASDTIEIAVVDIPPIDLYANPLKGCEPLTVQFLESSDYQGQTYVWNFGDAVFSYQKNPEHTFEQGTYNVILTVTSVHGCVMLDNKTIVVYPNPDAEFSAEPITASIIKPLIFFENLSTNDSITHWNFGDGDSVSIIFPGHTDHKYTRSGNFTVCLIAESKDGCKDTTCMDVLIKDEFTFYAPTAFSPDNDDINDVFLPVGIGIDPENFLMIIYDRWGEKVFVTHDLYQGWDGKIKGKNIGKNGVYSWLVIYKDLKGVEHQQAGAVSLIR